MNHETMQCMLQLQQLLHNNKAKGTAVAALKVVLDHAIEDHNQALIADVWTGVDIAEAAGWGAQPMLERDMIAVAAHVTAHHDAAVGVNWDVLSATAALLGVSHDS